MAKYYCFIAGLPEITIEDNKLPLSLQELVESIKEEVSVKDYQLIQLFLYQYDNENLWNLLTEQDKVHNELGLLSHEELLETINLFKEEEHPQASFIPPHFHDFLPYWIEGKPKNPDLSWEDNLSSAYYQYAIASSNEMIRNWFSFNLNALNLSTSINCRKFDFNIAEAVVGENEVTEMLINNRSKDFGLPVIFSYAEDILRISQIPSIVEREKKFDMLRWNWLDESDFFHYFAIEKIFAYLVKFSILDRWMSLDREKGEENLTRFITDLKISVNLSDEFKIQK